MAELTWEKPTGSDSISTTRAFQTNLPRSKENSPNRHHMGGPGPAVEINGTLDQAPYQSEFLNSAAIQEPPSDNATSVSATSKPTGGLKQPLGAPFAPLAINFNHPDPSPLLGKEPPYADNTLNGSGTGYGNGTPTAPRKSVQFSRDTEEIDIADSGQSTPPLEGSELDKPQSLYARLRALAIPQGFSHSRSASGLSTSGRSADGKDGDAQNNYFGRHDNALAATLEEDSAEEADDDADGEESAAERREPQSTSRNRRKRRIRRFDNIETAPSSPNSPMRPGLASVPQPSDRQRPPALARRVTDTDMPLVHKHQGLSEDEGRRNLSRETSAWTPRHPLRGLSYGGQRKPGDSTPEGQKRPLTLLNFAGITSSREAAPSDPSTPKTPSRRKIMSERGTSLSAARWKQLKNSLRLLGQTRKKERTPDHEKSAELLAELAAGTPAALMLASMFQRDEHDNRRIPILMEQLKLRITDSEVDKDRHKEADASTPSDRHLVFRIELEYGNGINRMKWVVKRSLGDFINLHAKYKLHYGSERLKGRGDASLDKFPKFPRSAFPYAKTWRGLDDETEEEDDPATNPEDTAVTDTEGRTPKLQSRPSFMPSRRRSSIGGIQDPESGGLRRDIRFADRQRKKLELYLQLMIKFLLFRPESNRLCKFLEVSALGMRLAAEGSFHGKEGYLLIRSAKGLDFRRALTPSNITHRHTPKWFLVRHSYVVCVDSPEEMHIYDVFLFDSDFCIQSKQRLKNHPRAKGLADAARESTGQHHRLKLINSERRLKLLARGERQLHQFEESIRIMIETSPWVKTNRFDSFAPLRPNCFAQWLVDGRDYMWVVSRAINQAKDVIYIHDWWLSPELYLRRPPAISQKWRLDRLLKRKAEQGVKIFVIVYRNIESAVPIDSQYTKFSLLDLHPNVFVQRSPNQFRQNTFFWAHHEKICIVDHTLAFVGGIDLCFGRWDTPQHTLVDDKSTGFEASDQPKDADHCQLWPGKDYSNPRIQDFYNLNKPYEEMYDRTRVARMPWHDISMQIVGQPARDLTRHFVQRWNYILRQRKPTRPTPFLLPPPDFNPADLEALGLDGTCEVQVLRSAGPWSLGTPDKTEHSIMNAYVKMIEESEHFVYMENQFFITSCETEGATVHNKIGDALVERITRAAKNGEAWRAVIIIPLIPGFQNTVEQEGGTSVRLIMQYQYRSICRGESSIFGRLKHLGVEPEDYIQFYSLRQWGRLGPNKTLVTEQLYIHAKCIIVDDRVALIGSANINERSMLGNRDSECAAIVRDTDLLWSKMNGKPYQVGRFPHTLRMRLMREHLGLDVDKIMEDAQVMEADHQKSEMAGRSAKSPSPADEVTSPQSEEEDTLTPLGKRTSELREELLQRSEDLKSFNHDVDWEQQDNPNLKSNRKLTEDSRVTGNASHRQDVEGQGFDHMAASDAAGLIVGRDSAIAKGAREVLISNLDTEGRAPVQKPRRHGDAVRLTSYVAKQETPNPPFPPRPTAERMNTEQLGLPMLSILPALPQGDDTDIGGPPLERSSSKDSVRTKHPLMNELRRPMVDRDCMMDPIHDAFLYDTWHAVAENNTKIYRSVFRCMPDNQVRTWEDYHQYIAYEHRFNQLQGHDVPNDDKIPHPAKSGPDTKSGPPGAGSHAPGAQLKSIARVPSDLEKHTSDLKDKVKGVLGGEGKEDQETAEKNNLRAWAAEANQAQADREGVSVADRQGILTLHRQETLTEERSGLQTVHEGQVIADEVSGEDDDGSMEPPNSSPSTNTVTEKERSPNADTPPPVSGAFVGYSEATNVNSAQGATAPGKRRRRGTTRSSRRDFSASDDILSVPEAEELLDCIQGHLIIWPYDWLEKVEAGSNWLFPFDQISPIEIYI